MLADDYGIVMGSSHCEQMLRNNVDEWERDGSGVCLSLGDARDLDPALLAATRPTASSRRS